MENYKQQTQRIIEKLDIVRQKDPTFKVFGADSHKYGIGRTLDIKTIENFEQEYNLDLPSCYKAFLTLVGNGNSIKGHRNSAVGPFYGIYPFASNIDELIENPKPYLQKECCLSPLMTDKQWDEISQEDDEEISEENYDEWLGNLFAGILPIGSQGCTYLHGLVLNGKYKGKVVNLDLSIQKPHFCFEDNFLDWYERWLDEIISGDLTTKNAASFGYDKGGTEDSLIEEYKNADIENKSRCLIGLLKKRVLSQSTYKFVEQEYHKCDDDLKFLFLHILAKFDYNKAKPYLFAYANKDLLTVLQAVHWYHKDKSKDWVNFIEAQVTPICNDNTFCFCNYIMENAKVDSSGFIIPFTKHADKDIRNTAFYHLGEQNNPERFIDVFIIGLQDNSNQVVHTTIQALYDIENKKLLKYYKKIALKYLKETDYILCNLKQNLKKYKLSLFKIRRISYEDLEKFSPKKWYQFWK